MTASPAGADPALDLLSCAAEPIRIPGGVQPHGALIVVEPATLSILQASANVAERLGLADPPQGSLSSIDGLSAVAEEVLKVNRTEPALSRVLPVRGRSFQVSTHQTDQGVIVEFEPPPAPDDQTLEALYPRIRGFLEAIAGAPQIGDIADVAVREVRALTGFNRILLYSFDAAGVGTVLAEATDGVLPSYLNLRFPAADIPAQARELYKLSRIRLIPDVDYQPSPIIPPLSPVDGAPLDLGKAALRSVSPVHREYMRNMGTASSMSISIIVEGELWGLISGHSEAPQQVNAQVRSACDHLGQILSLQIEARLQAQRSRESLRLRHVQAELLTRLAAAPNYAAGLSQNPATWEAVGGGAGAALVSAEEVIAVGLTPPHEAIQAIAARLFASGAGETATESMAELWPDSAAYAEAASGLLAVSISQIHPNYLMWFKPEAVRTVEWAGEPAKARELGERLHPRKSFQLWKEQLRLRSLPWAWEEVDSARAFRAAIQDFVLRRAEERAELTTRLAETNRELESFSYSISHDLRAPFRHVVGFAELLDDRLKGTMDATSAHYLGSIRDAALSAGQLVDDLLNFSQLGRNSLNMTRVDMNRLVRDVRRSMDPELGERNIVWTIGDLPAAWGDGPMLRQVVANLLENAGKYTAGRDPARIEITGQELAGGTAYTIVDNGVGFDMAYAHKLFAVFERLHRAEEFEGTGIGLALVRRIIERHDGEVSAHGAVGSGASFTFTIPQRPAAALFGEPILG